MSVLVGEKYGRLTVKAIVHGSIIGRRHDRNYIECICDCGNHKFYVPYCLTSGRTKSCGCYRASFRLKAHCNSKTRLHRIWRGMRNRCYNTKNKAYNDYGGRGISISEEWSNFENFKKWSMENSYNDLLSINRINNNGNYEPTNCNWTNQKNQARNTRRNKNITIDGVTKCMSAWAEDFGIKPNILWKRIKNGQSDKYVITKLLYESSIITHPHT